MDVELVIARYSENLDWVRDVNIDTTIYSKSKPELDYDFLKGNKKEFNIVKVEKEMFKGPSHSYCIHLFNNYHKLKKNTIFLQARPWDHLNNLILNLFNKEEESDYRGLQMLYKSTDELDIRKKFEKPLVDYLNGFENINEEIGFFSISLIHRDGGHIDLKEKLINRCNFSIKDFRSLFFPIGEQFVVGRKNILLNSEETYKDLVFLHENTHDGFCNRTIAYVMERLWFSIFNYNPY